MADDKDHSYEREYAEQRDDYHDPAAGETPEKMGIGRYLATRIPTLKPPMDKVDNPFKVPSLLNLKQWMFFLVAFIAWTWDSFDFFLCAQYVGDSGTMIAVA